MSLREITRSVASFAERTINGAEDAIGKNAETAVKSAAQTATAAATPDSSAMSAMSARFLQNNPLEDVTRSVAAQFAPNAERTAAPTQTQTAAPPAPQPAPQARRGGFFGWVGRAAENVANTAKSVVNTVVDAGKDAVNAVANTANTVFNAVAPVLTTAAKFVGNVVERGIDAGRSLVNGVVEGATGLIRSVAEGAWQTVQGVGKMLNPAPLLKVFQGDFAGAWQDVKSNFVSGITDVGRGLLKATVQAAADTFIVALSSGVSAVQTLVGLEPPSRALNNQEIAELRKVYGDTIDYSQIRLKEGNLGLNQLLAPHTVGNTIYIPEGSLDKNSSTYAADRNQLLVHETAHVWQYQNGGTDYISESLYNQAKGAIGGGSRNEAYEFEQPIRDGKSWTELNPEQQAHLIEEAYVKGLFDDPNARFIFDDGSDQTAFVRDAIEQMRAGRGAA